MINQSYSSFEAGSPEAVPTLRTPGPRFVIPAFFVGLILVLYGPTLSFQFTNWDDSEYVLHNPLIRDLSLLGLARIFSQCHFGDYLPILQLSYAWDYHFWGLLPAGYHLTNVLLHAVNTVLLFGFLKRLTGRNRVAVVATLLFAVHPLQVEAVSWVSGRKDLLATTFVLLTLIWHLRSREPEAPRNARGVAWGCYLLAAFSKAVVMGAPLLLIAYDRWFQKRPWRDTLRQAAPFLGISAVVAVLALTTQSALGAAKPSLANPLFFLLALRVLGEYLVAVLWPTALDNFYLYRLEEGLWRDPWVFLGLGVVGGAIILARRQPLGRPWGALTVLWFTVFLLPTLPLVPHSIPRADRYLYLPGIALFLLMALAFERVWEAWAPRRAGARRTSGLALGGGVAGLLIFLTAARLPVWRSSEALWQDHLRKNPTSVIGTYNLAEYYLMGKDYDRAFSLFQKTLKMAPNYLKAYWSLGVITAAQGRLEEAVSYYRTALRLAPQVPGIYKNLGNCYSRQGLHAQAIATYQQALRLAPHDLSARVNLGEAYLHAGERERARECFTAVLGVDPQNVEARQGLGQSES